MTLRFDANNTTNQTAGTLLITSTPTGANRGTITFQQYLPADVTSDPSEGFRLNLQAVVRNRTGYDWASYQLWLVDDYPAPDNPPGGVDVPQPHFHPGVYAPDEPMTFTSFTEFIGALGRDPTVEDPANHITLFDGIVGDGESLGVTNLLTHERQFTPGDLGGGTGLRVFRLVTWPGHLRRSVVPTSPDSVPYPDNLAPAPADPIPYP